MSVVFLTASFLCLCLSNVPKFDNCKNNFSKLFFRIFHSCFKRIGNNFRVCWFFGFGIGENWFFCFVSNENYFEKIKLNFWKPHCTLRCICKRMRWTDVDAERTYRENKYLVLFSLCLHKFLRVIFVKFKVKIVFGNNKSEFFKR